MAKSSAKSPAGRRAREGLKAGRTLNESDTATAEKAGVVNEAFVKDYLADLAHL
jgi:hypothetical protein